jgi:hypothetical protein
MQRVYKLIGNVNDELVEKLILLDRLIMFYSRFLKYWKTGKVYLREDDMVVVKFERIGRYGHYGFTERVFPVKDIGIRTRSYKQKIAREVKKRHENPRIQREREIHKWKLYIQNAKLDATVQV